MGGEPRLLVNDYYPVHHAPLPTSSTLFLYVGRLARAGKEVERKARPVQIYELEILECSLPVVRMRVVCSKGTYIRTLCADMGERLACGGTMQSLRRTRVGMLGLYHFLSGS